MAARREEGDALAADAPAPRDPADVPSGGTVRVRRQPRTPQPPVDAPSTPAAREASTGDAPRGEEPRRREITLPRYRQASEPARHAPPITPVPRRRAASVVLVGVILVAAVVAVLVLFLLVRG